MDREPLIRSDGPASLDIHPAYTFEAYAHTNSAEFTTETDWAQRWVDRAPIISIPLEISFGRFHGYTDFIIKQRLLDSLTSPVGLYEVPFRTNNTITDFFQLDLNWPYTAYVAANGKNWDLRMGRDRISWGNGHTGNLLVSDHQPFHDMLLFSAWSDLIGYTTGLIRFTPPDWGDGSGPGQTETSLDDYKALVAHRLTLRIPDSIQLTVTEAMMFQSDHLDIAFLNPAMIYHQYFMRSISNSMLTFELEWVPVNNLMLYGQFGIDELQILGESTSTTPNALGYLLGADYILPLSGSLLRFWGEFVHLDPCFYLRDGVNFITPIRSQYPEGNFTMVDYYLGYPWGGDLQTVACGVDWVPGSGTTASLSYTYLAKGETSPSSAYPPVNPQATAPSGIPEYRSILSLEGEFLLSQKIIPGADLTLGAGLAWYVVRNRDHVISGPEADLQSVISASIRF